MNSVYNRYTIPNVTSSTQQNQYKDSKFYNIDSLTVLSQSPYNEANCL